MSAERTPGFNTLAIHAGAQPDPATGARATPIYQTTSFVFDDVDHAAALFNLEAFGNIYTRITNPTQAVLEGRVAALEGGTAALAVASGHAAQALVFHTLLEPGAEFVAARQLYGGSINQFTHSFKKCGWQVRWADTTDPDSFRAALTPKTKAIFVESIANPGGIVTDLEKVAAVAKEAGVPFIVDNTLATPYLLRPKEYGADIVVHSLTKFLGGHGNSIGGAIVDCGTFDWIKSGRYPTLSEPSASYHGITLAETFGNFAFAIACRVLGLRDLGPAISPFNAFLLLTGIETLPFACSGIATTRLRSPPGLPPTTRSPGSTMRGCPAISSTRWPSAMCRKARAACSPSGSKAAMTPALRWSATSSCSAISPISAIRAA